MPGINALISLISTNVNAALVSANLPPLTDGGIVIGRNSIDINADVPRVVFVPRGSKFSARAQSSRGNRPAGGPQAQNTGASLKSVTVTQYGVGYVSPVVTFTGGGGTGATAVAVLNPLSGIKAIALTNGGSGYTSAPTVVITDGAATVQAAATANVGISAEQFAVSLSRAIFTDTVIFEVHCWGITGTADGTLSPDYNTDFDAAQLLYQQVIASAWDVAPGVLRPTNGVWMDSKPGVEQPLDRGRYFVCNIEIDTPLLDAPLTFAPVGVQPNPTLTMVSPTGGSGEAP